LPSFIHRLTTAGDAAAGALPLWLATEAGLPALRERLDPASRQWLQSQNFLAERGRVLTLPGREGGLGGAVAGLGPLASTDQVGVWDAAGWPDRLYGGAWALQAPLEARAATRVALGWLLGGYRYTGERASTPPLPPPATLAGPMGADVAYASAAARATAWARDLINTPANRLGPEELAGAAAALAAEFEAPA
jgi:leucyl aminopeptidase